jgi:hypothetical protein
MYLSREDSRTWIAVILGVIVIGATTLAFALHKVIGVDAVAWISSSLTVLSSLTCAVLCGLLWHHFRKGEILKRIWGSLWIGLMLWAVAEILYAYYDLSPLVEEPYPSWADAFFVPGFIPMFLALVFRYRSLRVTPPRKLVIISGAAFGTVAAFWLIFVLGPIIESPGAGSLIEQLLDIYYPLGDLLIVMGALLSMLALAGGELSLPWGAIALACLTLAFSDSLYSYATWKDIYQPAGGPNFITALCDTAYVAGYVILAFGLYVQARLQRIL